MTEPPDYEVGYRRPPKTTRFKQGKSGNPSGRPKKSRDPITLLMKQFMKKIKVIEDGKKITITKYEAAFAQFANQRAKGDPQARRDLFKFLKEHGDVFDEPPQPVQIIIRTENASKRDKELEK